MSYLKNGQDQSLYLFSVGFMNEHVAQNAESDVDDLGIWPLEQLDKLLNQAAPDQECRPVVIFRFDGYQSPINLVKMQIIILKVMIFGTLHSKSSSYSIL